MCKLVQDISIFDDSRHTKLTSVLWSIIHLKLLWFKLHRKQNVSLNWYHFCQPSKKNTMDWPGFIFSWMCVHREVILFLPNWKSFVLPGQGVVGKVDLLVDHSWTRGLFNNVQSSLRIKIYFLSLFQEKFLCFLWIWNGRSTVPSPAQENVLLWVFNFSIPLAATVDFMVYRCGPKWSSQRRR